MSDGYIGSLFPEMELPEENVNPQPKKPTKAEALSTRVNQLETENAELKQKLEVLEAQNRKLQEKADMYDALSSPDSTFKTTVVAKSIGWSAIQLNQYLAKKGIQYKQGEDWVLKQPYASRKLHQISWYNYGKDKLGRDLFRSGMVWTMEGVKFIRDLVKKDGLLEY